VPVVVSLALSACATPSAPSPVLTFFFDDVPPPGTDRPAAAVAHLPRRPPYKKPPPLAEEIEFADLPPAIDWRARYEALAKNDAGDVDWIRALNDKIIAPKPGIAADAKDAEPTDMDLEYVPEGQPKFKVVFPHRPHTHWLGCPNCHTDIFEMEKGKAKMTMDKLNGGAYCGVCHGKVALPELTNCPACHKAM
jgi:c(7)-type cytochrome triheme protein